MGALQALAVGSIPSSSIHNNNHMLHKLKQQTTRYRLTSSNRLPLRRARQFLLNYLRLVREEATSPKLRAAMGLIRWSSLRSFHGEDRISFRSGCFITGRARGTSQRFTVSRTRVKSLSGEGKLFGVRKSS
jgi:ribosomal protein S14